MTWNVDSMAKGVDSPPPSERKSKSILIFPSGSIFDHQVTDTLVSSAWKAIVSKTPQNSPKLPRFWQKLPKTLKKGHFSTWNSPKLYGGIFLLQSVYFLSYLCISERKGEKWKRKTDPLTAPANCPPETGWTRSIATEGVDITLTRSSVHRSLTYWHNINGERWAKLHNHCRWKVGEGTHRYND